MESFNECDINKYDFIPDDWSDADSIFSSFCIFAAYIDYDLYEYTFAKYIKYKKIVVEWVNKGEKYTSNDAVNLKKTDFHAYKTLHLWVRFLDTVNENPNNINK